MVSFFRNLGKDRFKQLTQKFDEKMPNLVQQKGFYSYKYIIYFEKILPSKQSFCGSFTVKKFNDRYFVDNKSFQFLSCLILI